MIATDSRIKIAVIYGGRSSEHSISCVSAGAIMQHLDPSRFEIIPLGITQDGTWTVGESDPRNLLIQGRTLPKVQLKEEIRLAHTPANKGEIRYLDGRLYARVDVIFPVLHGPYGEDGTIQGFFDLSGIPYVGCGVLASACSMDKEYTKRILGAAGLPVGREKVLGPGEILSATDRDSLGLPAFVKPARGGSSIGISRIESWEELDQALIEARQYDAKVVIESEIIGSEIECGVLENAEGTLRASVPAQLVDTDASEGGFYDFDTKYLDSVVSAVIPAAIPHNHTAEIQRLAIEAFKALDCTGLARVDFFLTDHGPVINEINTMPGFTPISMYPQVLAASGVDYPELLEILIDHALNCNRR
ncbi:D-alanine--D-alanine ligase [Corynebacterium sp. ES2730-CONJ]|uniref:D-alanine--D-alanine ligase family protein n=1 Tax=Corynebacterium sp. ES2730-CONJ TaxID=2973941 RepID=UPI00216ACCCB|nr:D-alanine--D-alanine ligase family protein [Corynebacterium sp. ES2730-CONJ]MCS4532625.1 D-alanine--D-alanine ligase [Corynebacterium sp. ES2730-CONJ]